LYENFIRDFEHRINVVSLVEICLIIVRYYQNADAALKFLQSLKEKVAYDKKAGILCNTAIGSIYLAQKNVEQTKKYVEETEKDLNDLDGVTTVHARFYELCSNYHRNNGNHSDYYKNALRYLGCIKHEDLTLNEKQERAFYLSLAALLGDGIYNFGELLMHPILNSLRETPNQWLIEVLFAFNRGDINEFDKLKSVWQQQADLLAAEVKMRQKICLLCLMEMAFTRSANNKTLTFNDIALKTKLPEDEVILL
jgi:26S proteasome regulatory subunit N9